MTVELIHGDCLEVMPTLPDASVDAIITDPPYPEIDRDYGRMSEPEWWDLMMGICREARRVLKPTGSAVFILQPNSRKVGSMRGWLWEFMAWVCREWNMVQDVWWWRIDAPPGVHVHSDIGLSRPSVKACVWAGSCGCFRKQSLVMWTAAQATIADKRADSVLRRNPSGYTGRNGRKLARAKATGEVTPYNLLPISNSDAFGSAGAHGHGAGTPLELAKWWTRYICPPGGVVLDPFAGSGTMGLAAIGYGDSFIGIERMDKHYQTMRRRIDAARLPLEMAA